MMGCDEDAGRTVFVCHDVEYRRCPLFYITPEVREFLSYYGHYREGFLPEAGGVTDQAATFLDAVRFLSAEIAKIHERRQDT